MESIRTISCKLTLLPHQKSHVDATLKAFADACNFVADYGRKHNVTRQFPLHHACYKDVRKKFGLSANLAVRAIARVAPRLLKAKTRDSIFKPTSVDYDARIFRFRESDWTVGLTLLSSRERLALDVGKYQKQALSGRLPTSATLTKKGKGYFLDIQIEELAPDPATPTNTLGVDLGIKKVATLSSGESFGGTALNSYRLTRHKVRKSLQSKADKGSPCTRKNARRILKRLSGKEYRYQTWINHQISKEVVTQAKASGSAIVLEDLKGIRDRTNRRLRKSQRGLHNTWAFYQLRAFIEYKARRAGVQVALVDPRYTSQTCSVCQHIGSRRGERFTCTNCGSVMDADLNGALNIAAVGGISVNCPGYPHLSCSLSLGVSEAAG
jgi:IS605 OrfB family transposase